MTTQVDEQFREVLGHFSTGVTVITAMTPAGPVGFTCQSFSSLSLSPPLVLVLPGKSSTSWPQIASTGKFCVNVLAEDQQHISAAFARKGADKFDGVSWAPSPQGLPILDGSCAWIESDIEESYPGGDHLIVTGRVRHLGSCSDSSPLLFHRGQYRGTRSLWPSLATAWGAAV